VIKSWIGAQQALVGAAVQADKISVFIFFFISHTWYHTTHANVRFFVFSCLGSAGPLCDQIAHRCSKGTGGGGG